MKIEHYKEARTFKGFEAWWHTIQMTMKMHITIMMMIFGLQLFVSFLLFFLFDKRAFNLCLKAFFIFDPHLWWVAVKLIINKLLLYFLLTIPFWLLYPVLLAKFKIKAKNIMRDEFMRGSRLVSEDELRKIVLQDLRKEFENIKEGV